MLQINGDLSPGSATLAYRKFRGTHSFDKIAELLDSMMLENGLFYRNVVSMVTDKATNLVKYFKEFGVYNSNDYADENDGE